MSERDFALMECARNDFVESYFKARPQLMRTTHEERLVEAGFTAAWSTHPAPDRVAELERERQISAELSRKVVALEQQLAESREREGRMRGVLEAFDKAARESGSIIGFAGKAFKLITNVRAALAADKEKNYE